jgi:hypothetical protein
VQHEIAKRLSALLEVSDRATTARVLDLAKAIVDGPAVDDLSGIGEAIARAALSEFDHAVLDVDLFERIGALVAWAMYAQHAASSAALWSRPDEAIDEFFALAGGRP